LLRLSFNRNWTIGLWSGRLPRHTAIHNSYACDP